MTRSPHTPYSIYSKRAIVQRHGMEGVGMNSRGVDHEILQNMRILSFKPCSGAKVQPYAMNSGFSRPQRYLLKVVVFFFCFFFPGVLNSPGIGA